MIKNIKILKENEPFKQKEEQKATINQYYGSRFHVTLPLRASLHDELMEDIRAFMEREIRRRAQGNNP